MKKNRLLYGFMTVMCLFTLFEGSAQSNQPVVDNYISITNGEFMDGDNVFKPLCINYIVDYACNISNPLNKIYYIAPHSNYSNDYVAHFQTELNDTVYPNGHFGYGINGVIEMNVAKAKLEHDLKVMDSLGFNVVRIAPAIRWRNNELQIPTGSYAKYFELTDTLIAKCARHNLRVILVLCADTNTYKQFDQYCIYLDSVSRHYSNNKTVMAYVVYAEPSYKWGNAKENDKIMISNWSRKWYYIIKQNAPNQLVTYGLDGIGVVRDWDPSALTYDFMSMHFYHPTADYDSSRKTVECYFKWMNDNVEDVWILGETGFSGTDDSCMADSQVGSESAQYQYADYTMQKSLDCGCKGYAWWQYQEVMWESCCSKYYGFVKFFDKTKMPPEELKMAHSLFPLYNYREPGVQCARPGRYYNIPGHSYNNFSGVVRDNNSNPIKDALVLAWSVNSYTVYSTFTNSQGEYTIHTPQDTVVELVWISQKGYTDKFFFHTNNAFESTTLNRINYNGWKKNWTNVNYPETGSNPMIGNSDIVMVGNFYGSEAQEMLVIKPSASMASIYIFHTNHWEQRWTGSIGNWQISSTDNYYAGDFNGDGYDELLCVQNALNAAVSIYHYDISNLSDPWTSIWSNNGNGSLGGWNYHPGDVILPGHFNDTTVCSLLCIRNSGRPEGALCQRMASNSWVSIWMAPTLLSPVHIGGWSLSANDKYYVGDFNGDGIDELFCVQVTNGSSDNMALLRYSTSWNTLWSNNGISHGIDIYPYRADLHIGNFDSDREDEILGIGTNAAKFDFNSSSQWDMSWSTGNSGKISDWAINSNHRIFFQKVMKGVPDYLFVSRWELYHHLFDAYSFDP